MSDTEEEACFYGTPLEPYDEDAFPKKRPITVEEQVAKDAQGRRRFHGAFTGGFSAGFFNTVGSLEGWTPSEFKSSRGDKAENRMQKPEDYMDDEDIGEFGIAPQTVRATSDYATGNKRKKQVFSDGPIPGQPVLETLLQAGNETVGYFLMKNMNRKHRKEEAEKQKGPKVYGCEMPKDLPDEIEVPQYELHEIYKHYLANPKANTFGLGYVGLEKTHVNLFQPVKLTVHERNNKKLSISGQAFGVGAFEDDDEDIYVKDDMSRYDFELTAESSNKEKKSEKTDLILGAFVLAKGNLVRQQTFPPPTIPSSFTGKHKVKKSRFEPLMEETKLPDRRSMNASIRAKYLGEENTEQTNTSSNQQHKQDTKIESQIENVKKAPANVNVEKDQQAASSGLLFDRFVSAKQDDDVTNILEPVKHSETTHGTKEMHAAVKMKMFGPLTRVTLCWQPCTLLCKRFNVPEPRSEELNSQKNKKRTKNLIFEYQKHVENELLHKPGLSIQATDSTHDTNESTSNNIQEVRKEPICNDNQKASTSRLSEESQTHIEAEKNFDEEQETENQNSNENNPSSNRVIDITERIDVAKNMDLFKAVFQSSSESESESEAVDEKEDEQRKELLTANVVSEPLVPKIKPMKEGILSNIDFSKFQKPKTVDEEQKNETEVNKNVKPPEEDNTYGPKLPTKVASFNPMVVNETVMNRDEWVEKGWVEKQKKHKKKHKKEKDKEKHKKKHKHKSKK